MLHFTKYFIFSTVLITVGKLQAQQSVKAISPEIPTSNGITLVGGTDLSADAGTITERGVVFKADSKVETIDDIDLRISHKNMGGNLTTGTDEYKVENVTGLDPKKHYFYEAYILNVTDPKIATISNQGYNFWTLAPSPGHSTILELESKTSRSIELRYSGLNLPKNTVDGYVLLRKEGNTAPDGKLLEDGKAPPTAEELGSAVDKVVIITDGSTYNDTGLKPETTYSYTLVSFNKGINDDATYNYKTDGTIPTISATTHPKAPGPITDLRAINVRTNSFELIWNAPERAESYIVEVSENNDFSSPLADYPKNDVTDTEIKVTGLKENTKYYYRVAAKNSGGNSASRNGNVTTGSPKQAQLIIAASNPSNTTFCEGDEIKFLALPEGKTEYTFWVDVGSGFNKAQDNNMDTYTFNALNKGNAKVKVGIAGFADSKTISLTIHPKPNNVVFDRLSSDENVDVNNLNTSLPDVALDAATPDGGVYSGPGVYRDDDMNYFFSPTSGNYEITYTYTDNNGCSDMKALNINVLDEDTKITTDLKDEYCDNIASVGFSIRLFTKAFEKVRPGTDEYYYTECEDSRDKSTCDCKYRVRNELADTDPVKRAYVIDPFSGETDREISDAMSNVQVSYNEDDPTSPYYEVSGKFHPNVIESPFVFVTLELDAEVVYDIAVNTDAPETCEFTRDPITLTSRYVSRINVRNSAKPDIETLTKDSFCEGSPEFIELNPITKAKTGLSIPDPSDGFFSYRKRGEEDIFRTLPDNIIVLGAFETGEYFIRYTYNGNSDYCKESSALDTISVTPPPTGKFEVDETTLCFGDSVKFTYSDKSYDPNTTKGWTWEWGFGDGNSSDEVSPKHRYATIGTNTVSLTVKSDSVSTCKGSSLNSGVTIKPIPKGDFESFGLCEGNATVLAPRIPKDEGVDDIAWSISGSNTEKITAYNYIDNSSSKREVILSESGLTTIDLIPTNSFGCSDTISKNYFVFPSVSGDGFADNFDTPETVAQRWSNSGQTAPYEISSWQLIGTEGNFIWRTMAQGDSTYANNEQSYIESPCFDFSGFEHPFLSLDILGDVEEGKDGAVVLYTADNGIRWKPLGDNQGSGINWYTEDNITGSPGLGSNIDRLGWSDGDSTWRNARYALSAVQEEAGADKVRFRIAFGSNGDNPEEETFSGFAFDNFQLQERNRINLLEHFTNMRGNHEHIDEDRFVHQFALDRKGEAIDIQYHIRLINNYDPIADFDNTFPSAQALHYGIGYFPRTVLNGFSPLERIAMPFSELENKNIIYDKEALTSAAFDIDVRQEIVPKDFTQRLKFDITVTKNSTLEPIDEFVIIEPVIVQTRVQIDDKVYPNVARKILPDATGVTMDGDWSASGESDAPQTKTVYWNPRFDVDTDGSDGVVDTILLVTYVYNEDRFNATKEVYQVRVDTIPLSNIPPPHSTVVGLFEGNRKEGMTLFPNPATDILSVRFARPLEKEHVLLIYDALGKVVKEQMVPVGKSNVSIETKHLLSGLYNLQLMEGNHSVMLRFEVLH